MQPPPSAASSIHAPAVRFIASPLRPGNGDGLPRLARGGPETPSLSRPFPPLPRLPTGHPAGFHLLPVVVRGYTRPEGDRNFRQIRKILPMSWSKALLVSLLVSSIL